MTTRRKPWPEWAETDYFSLRRQTRRARQMAEKAREIQHQNIYLTADMLSRLVSVGQQITSTARRLELDKGGRKWPDWANRALSTAKRGGKFIEAGGKHGLDGINQDNWKMVLISITTCIEYAGKIEAALLEGPPPASEIDRAVESALKREVNGRTHP